MASHASGPLAAGTDQRVRHMYETSVAAIRTHLVRQGGPSRCSNCTFLARWNHATNTYTDTMDHLACFVPGMLALGAHGDTRDADLACVAASNLPIPLLRLRLASPPAGVAPAHPAGPPPPHAHAHARPPSWPTASTCTCTSPPTQLAHRLHMRALPPCLLAPHPPSSPPIPPPHPWLRSAGSPPI